MHRVSQASSGGLEEASPGLKEWFNGSSFPAVLLFHPLPSDAQQAPGLHFATGVGWKSQESGQNLVPTHKLHPGAAGPSCPGSPGGTQTSQPSISRDAALHCPAPTSAGCQLQHRGQPPPCSGPPSCWHDALEWLPGAEAGQIKRKKWVFIKGLQ